TVDRAGGVGRVVVAQVAQPDALLGDLRTVRSARGDRRSERAEGDRGAVERVGLVLAQGVALDDSEAGDPPDGGVGQRAGGDGVTGVAGLADPLGLEQRELYRGPDDEHATL